MESRQSVGMETVTVFSDERVSLWYHPDSKIIHHQIHQFLPQGVFVKLLTAGADALEEHGCHKWLSDDRGNTVVRQEDGQWAETEWGPRVIRAGLKYWAIVLPAAVVGQLQMQRYRDEYLARGVKVQMFTDPEAAMTWLRSR